MSRTYESFVQELIDERDAAHETIDAAFDACLARLAELFAPDSAIARRALFDHGRAPPLLH